MFAALLPPAASLKSVSLGDRSAFLAFAAGLLALVAGDLLDPLAAVAAALVCGGAGAGVVAERGGAPGHLRYWRIATFVFVLATLCATAWERIAPGTALALLLTFVAGRRWFSLRRQRHLATIWSSSSVSVLLGASVAANGWAALALLTWTVATLLLFPVLAAAVEDRRGGRWRVPLRYPALHSLPAMLALGAVLFLVIPRRERSVDPLALAYRGDRRSDQDRRAYANSGLSAAIRPGAAESVRESQEVAFRVTLPAAGFFLTTPRFRVSVLDEWDGESWRLRENPAGAPPRRLDARVQGASLLLNPSPEQLRAHLDRGGLAATPGTAADSYQVTLEGHPARELPLLSGTVAISGLAGAQLYLSGDGRLLAMAGEGAAGGRFSLLVSDRGPRTHVSDVPQVWHSELAANANTALYEATLERAVLRGGEPEQTARNLELWLKRDGEYATGRLPATVDEFLTGPMSGHCEFFAASLALLLRTEGIPARLVTGYSGGSYEEVPGGAAPEFVVRKSNAHVWVEAWIEGKGWIELDPTPPPPLGFDGLPTAERTSVRTVVAAVGEAFENFGPETQRRLLAAIPVRLPEIWSGENFARLRRVLPRLGENVLELPVIGLAIGLILLNVLAWRLHRLHVARREGGTGWARSGLLGKLLTEAGAPLRAVRGSAGGAAMLATALSERVTDRAAVEEIVRLYEVARFGPPSSRERAAAEAIRQVRVATAGEA